jgi:NitT/TauT family transport system substrate-binding protein
MKISNFCRAIFFALVAFTGTAVLAQTTPARIETVRIQKYPGATSMLALVAAKKGFCEKYGLKCEFVNISSSVLSLQAMLSGSLEVATPAVGPALQLAAKGTPIKFMGNIAYTSPYMLAVAGPALNSGVRTGYPGMIHDLKGKKVGVTARGSGPEYVLTTLLRDAGMKPSDVTIVGIGGPDTSYAALANNQVDAALSFEPLGSFCEVLKACHVSLSLATGEGPKELNALNGAYGPMVVRADYAEKNPKVIKALRSAFKDAENFIHVSANFDELTNILKNDFELDHPQSGELIVAMMRNALPFLYSELDAKALQETSNYMYRTGQITAAYNTDKLILP